MSELEEAMTRLDRAVARLEAASDSGEREAEHQRLRETLGQIAMRVDNALARIDLALRGES
jgi:hypothetical protein